MKIQNSQNISTNSVTQTTSPVNNKPTESNFAEELKNAKENKKSDEADKSDSSKDENEKIKKDTEGSKEVEENADDAIDGLENTVNEIIKANKKDAKTENEDTCLIDNNMNIQEQTELLNAQTSTNMHFNSNGQPFSQFMNSKNNNELSSSASDLEEEKSILSTMEENIAIARKNMMLKNEAKTVTVQNEEGIKKVNSKTNILVDTIVKYDTVIMDENDVNFFTNLVENGSVNLNEVKNAEKSSHVSKTLADLLAKSMNENKPVRINFDNNISVIIRIDRAGKISADFLPSSQIAETYLKDNLPLLRQRFDDNNIDYNELNQRKQKQDTQDNRKKGRKDE